MQSQTAAMHLTADKAVDVASTHGMVKVTAPKHILLTAAGAAIRIQSGNITLSGPGTVEFRASMKVLTSAGAASQGLALKGQATLKGCPKAQAQASSAQSATLELA